MSKEWEDMIKRRKALTTNYPDNALNSLVSAVVADRVATKIESNHLEAIAAKKKAKKKRNIARSQ